MLSFDNVEYRYRRRSGRNVIKRLSWDIDSGSTVILGPNGAGKSTLLCLGASVLKPQSGVVAYTNAKGDRLTGNDMRRSIGWMPQHIAAVEGLKCREQVAYFGWLMGMNKSDAWAAAAKRLDDVGLPKRADDKASQLSGGQLRRLGLAQTLIAKPRLLLLDEPTAGLDPAQRKNFRTMLRDLGDRHNVDIVVSTHEIADLSTMFTTVAVLDGGRLVFTGPVSEFLAHSNVGRSGPAAAESAYSYFIDEGRS